MKTTGNLGLKKPDGTDIVDITDLNGNMDILDTAVKAVQDHAADTVKHITAMERTAWNAKASTSVATTTVAGLMAGADKSKLDSVAQGANNYVHPSTHSPSVIVQDSSNRFVTDAEKTAWNGKANLVTTPQQTTADITYYVRTDGNDGNTGLGNTAGGAFRTIGRAVKAIPKMANNTININVAAGTYAEAVVITGFVTSDLFALTASGNVSVTSIEVNNSHGVFVIKGFTATSTTAVGAFKVSASRRVVFESCVVTTQSAQAGVYVSASDVFVDRCNVSNRGNAVVILAECVAYASNNTGVNNGAAYLSGFASYFGYSGTVPAGNMVAQDGGMLVPGMGVLNPWGDNNTQSRTGAAGGSTAAQNMVSNTMTKLVYNGKYFDYLNEWNPATGTFTPSRTGMYSFDILCSLQGVPDGVVISLHMFKNGTEDQCIGRNTNSGSSVSVTSGHVTTDLTAGQPVSIYLHQSHSSGLSTTGSNLYNWFRVTRVS